MAGCRPSWDVAYDPTPSAPAVASSSVSPHGVSQAFGLLSAVQWFAMKLAVRARVDWLALATGKAAGCVGEFRRTERSGQERSIMSYGGSEFMSFLQLNSIPTARPYIWCFGALRKHSGRICGPRKGGRRLARYLSLSQPSRSESRLAIYSGFLVRHLAVNLK